MTKAKKIPKRRSGFVIREFRIVEYDALIELWNGAGLPHKPRGRDTKKNISSEIHHANAIFLVAEKEGTLIGSAFGTHDGRKGWINRVAVLPEYRRSGLATQLVREVEKRLTDAGIDIIACLIEEWNKESVTFFERLGYKRHNDISYFTKRRYPDI
ncbi:MAG: GNAT family N-acetyltransferase [candidate division WOR-3 bacterium]|nr:MAG: GNAT family N-acetyltransferase [candidate division WOR-3 bacterium]